MKNVKTVMTLLNELKFIMNKEQKKKCVRLILIVLIGSLFELLGVSAILPFIQSIMYPEVLLEKWYMKPFASIFGSNTDYLIFFGGGVIGIVYLLKNLYLCFSAYMQAAFRCKFQKDLSIRVLNSYMELPYIDLIEINSHKILRAIGLDIDGVYSIVENIFKFLSELLTVVLIGIFIIYTDWIMAIGILFLALFCLLFVTFCLKSKMNLLGRTQRNIMYKKSAQAHQAIAGNKEIKVMNRTNSFMKEYANIADSLQNISIRFNFISALPERVIETICISGIIGVVCARILLGVELSGFIPKLGTFAVAAFRILPCISRMTGDINNIVFYKASLEAVYDSLVQQMLRENKGKNRNKYSAGEVISFREKLVVNNIEWKYPQSIEPVISKLNLSIIKGESVALIGESGAGKTTLVDMILGLFEPSSGSIEMDGIDIYSMPQQWSKIIGYVPQAIFLIDDTIRENITFGLEKEQVDDGMVWRALEQAQLKEFVESLPEGLDTIVGERGIKISGGQRQRIAIARALYYNPDILVLDEATSALDNDTEAAVMEAIDSLRGKKTLIIIAHRLSTISNCDKVYEISNGKAIEVKRKSFIEEELK